MSEPNPIDELAGHLLKIFTVGMLAFMVIAIVTSAGEGPTRQLIYWSLIALFVTCGALLGRLGAHQLSRQFAPSERNPGESGEVSSAREIPEPEREFSVQRSRRPPARREHLATRRPNVDSSGDLSSI